MKRRAEFKNSLVGGTGGQTMKETRACIPLGLYHKSCATAACRKLDMKFSNWTQFHWGGTDHTCTYPSVCKWVTLSRGHVWYMYTYICSVAGYGNWCFFRKLCIYMYSRFGRLTNRHVLFLPLSELSIHLSPPWQPGKQNTDCHTRAAHQHMRHEIDDYRTIKTCMFVPMWRQQPWTHK